MPPSRWRFGIGLGLAAILVAAGGFLMLTHRPFSGYQFSLILSGSMEPHLRTGSVVLTRRLPPWRYRVGDVVTFVAPVPGHLVVTHRIAAIYRNEHGVAVIRTKGDANSNGDQWATSLGSVTGKEVLAVPYIGYGLAWLKTRLGFLVFSLAFFLLCVAAELIWIGTLVRRLLARPPGSPMSWNGEP